MFLQFFQIFATGLDVAYFRSVSVQYYRMFQEFMPFFVVCVFSVFTRQACRTHAVYSILCPVTFVTLNYILGISTLVNYS